MSDIVFIERARLPCHIGVTPKERSTAQDILVDVELALDLSAAAATDAIAETVNYSEVWELARACTAEREFRLVETLAHSIGRAIVERFGRVEAATVRVTKPAALASRGAEGAGAQLTVRRSGT